MEKKGKKKKKKRLIWVLLIAGLLLCLITCGLDDEDAEEETGYVSQDYESGDSETGKTELAGESGDPDQSWAIYWYLCGSDLESENGFASNDLSEMMDVSLPENVKVVIETGGASTWMNDFVDSGCIGRYLYSSGGMELIEQKSSANMGDPGTLADFLRFCKNNYPADRTMVIFWNHGGGSVSGANFDENYNYDSLTLNEYRQAFKSVYSLSAENPPIDVIGFDACLMGTIDTADAFSDVARYLVASEEMEPAIGWCYSGWMKALAEDPGMDGARLGQHICDSYMEDCSWYWLDSEATLSVVDLGKLPPLLEAYDNMGREALQQALGDPRFFGSLSREAEISENYGGNTRDQGYSNMVDLGHLARNCSGILPQTSRAVLEELDNCVIYQVKGDYRENASGLSCYYSYNGDRDDFRAYKEVGCSEAFKSLYGYCLEGNLGQRGMKMAESCGYDEETIQDVPELDPAADYEYPLYIDDDDYVVLELDRETTDMLKGVYFQLAYVDEENDVMLLLGQDDDIDADWENGIFKDNFRGVWGAIDDHLVYMEIYYQGDDYTAYSVPILLNGEEYNLRVTYNFNDEQFHILGARKGLDETGMADKNLVQLKPGDEITTIHYAATVSGDEDFQQVPVESFTVTENTKFDEMDMGDGVFLMMFELADAKNNSAYSEIVQFTVSGDIMDIDILS
ncbi:MAG: clostripain-related cysteine peptidase [Candidatus Limivicinus sp.]|jgi:hypothetical protein